MDRDNGTYGSPFNREIGRLFLDTSISALSLLNPNIELKKDEIREPLIIDLYKKHGKLDVLNVGCGGCADIPLLKKTITETLNEYDISNPKIKIVNVDIDSGLVRKVKNSELEYFKYSDVMGVDETLKKPNKRVERYLRETFDFCEKRGIERTNIMGRHPINVDSFLMKRDISSELNVAVANSTHLPFPEKSFNLVLMHYLIPHLKEGDELENTIDEVSRVTKKNGIVFPNYGIYEKTSLFGELFRMSGFYGYAGPNPEPIKDSIGRVFLKNPKDKSSIFCLEKYEKGYGFYASNNHDDLFQFRTARKLFNRLYDKIENIERNPEKYPISSWVLGILGL